MRQGTFPKPESLADARRLQLELAKAVKLAGNADNIRYLAVLDASIKYGEDLIAAAVLWDRQQEQAVQVGLAHLPADEVFPYIPGFLSFREAPVYLAALAELSQPPDMLLVDGQGIAHPRGLGIAAHLGVYLDIPAVGVAKSRLYGKPQGELGETKGDAIPLMAGERQLGWVYRSRTQVKPLYISPGNCMGMAETLAFVRGLPGKTRHPEPLKAAHNWAGRGRKEKLRGLLELDA